MKWWAGVATMVDVIPAGTRQSVLVDTATDMIGADNVYRDTLSQIKNT